MRPKITKVGGNNGEYIQCARWSKMIENEQLPSATPGLVNHGQQCFIMADFGTWDAGQV